MRRIFSISILSAAILFAAETVPSFTQDVAPILRENCNGCHSKSVSMGSLDLGTFEGVMKGGKNGPSIVSGKSAESRLYLMTTGKLQPAMPMGGKTLAAGDLETIRKWIDAGATAPGLGEAVAAKSSNAIPNIAPKVAVKPAVYALAWRGDGQMLAIGGYKEIRLLDAQGKVTGKLAGFQEAVRAVAFSKDGKLLIGAGGLPAQKGELKIWDVASGKEIATAFGHADAIYAAAFSPDGKWIATASYDKLIKIWDTAGAKEVKTLKDHIDTIYSLVFTPDGSRLISGAADRTVKVWDIATGTRLFTMSEPTDGINSVAIDPQGKMIAAAGQDKSIRLWSLSDRAGTLVNSLIAHEDAILRIAWSHDGKYLLSTSADKVVKLFLAEGLKEIASYPGQSDWVNGLAFSSDDARFVAARFDGSIQFYPVTR